MHLRVKPSSLCPIAEYQAVNGAALDFAADAADPQAVAPLSLAPQEKVKLDLTFPAQLTLGAQTPTGAVKFLCDFDVTFDSTP
ncbi:MAG: hypothetical protein CML51_03720 [Rhodobacteraceae bacterium]|nr:hypothetical protein [Paracoccaceae bacterium]